MSDDVKVAIAGGMFGLVMMSLIWSVARYAVPETPKEPLREAQRQALERYITLTEVMRKETLAYLQSYQREQLRLQADGYSPEDATAQLEQGLRQRIDDDEAMPAACPQLEINDKNWEAIAKERRYAFSDFLHAVRESAADGNDPVTDDALNRLQQTLIAERQKIAAECRALLVNQQGPARVTSPTMHGSQNGR